MENINLLSTILAVFILGFLGFLVYSNNRKGSVNKAFLFFALIDIFWNIFNYLSYQFINSLNITFLLARLDIFFAVWHGFAIFNFIYIFINKETKLTKKYKFILIPFVSFVSLLNLTPFVFNRIEKTADNFKIINSPGILIFGVTVTGLILYGIYLLSKKRNETEGMERNQYSLVLFGISATFLLHIIFNFIYPSFLNDLRFVPMGGIFTFPFIGFTTYAILKHKLFNIKVIAAEFLTFAIWITLLIKVFLAESQTDRIVGGFIFFATVIFGIMLIKSVLKEVRVKEELQKLYGDLRIADEKLKKIDEEKSEFLFITSHQLRTPMTIIKGYISMMLEGDFGDLDARLTAIINKIYISNERLVKIINDLLDLSRIERGKMDYSFKECGLEKIVSESISELKPNLKDKKLKLVFNRPKKELSKVLIDEDYTRQVIVNLIDNAIKYTNKDKSEIKIKLEEHGDIIRFSIKDQGTGISGETMPHLFQRYSREEKTYSKASRGMGLGLYIARRIVEDQHGKIWAESKGEGYGSTFFVELPVAG